MSEKDFCPIQLYFQQYHGLHFNTMQGKEHPLGLIFLCPNGSAIRWQPGRSYNVGDIASSIGVRYVMHGEKIECMY